MSRRFLLIAVYRCALLPFVLLAPAYGAGLPDRAVAILRDNCLQCHNRTVTLSNLDLSSRDAALKGGARGPAITPGNSSGSRMYQAITHVATPSMPPGKKLPQETLNIIRDWIDGGAAWPEAGGAGPSTWWSFKKPVRPPVPEIKGGPVSSPVDAFLLHRMTAQGLKPSPEASKAVLARRLYFDLHGLPPTYSEIREFVEDKSPDAYEKLVDRLLASPRYGEKWARHWLDLVRYSDTAGFELDSYISDAWRYRDYVIQSFNEDKPYDRFIKEQIAGDEFFPEDPVAQTGTGFFCVGPNRDLFPDQADINRVETLTDYVDTTGAAFLGLTVGCARCHDHKYDPISQKDYYRIQAVFAPGVKTKVALNRLTSLSWERGENTREIKLREIGDQIRRLSERCRKQIFETKLAALPNDVQAALRLNDAERTQQQRELAAKYGNRARVTENEIEACRSPEERDRLRSIEKRLVSMFSSYAPKPFACGFTDAGDYGPKTYLPGQGNEKGEEVKPGFPAALGGGDIPERSFERPVTGPIPLGPTTGRRKALADWIATPENPLTARVMVNRIWQYHFGQGIVATPSNFGARGRLPSHPELLDWLASEFVARGWSVMAMHRLILNSAAYRRTSNASAEARAKDPENIWLSYFRRRRIDAEELRDAVLAGTRSLKLEMGGRPVVLPLTSEELYNLIGRKEEMWIETEDERQHNRRSIYLYQKRTFRAPMLEVFDAPESMLTCARRDLSTTAPQSLTLLNGNFAVKQARSFAEKLAAKHAEDRDAVRAAWQAVLGRDPAEPETADTFEFLSAQRRNGGTREFALTEMVRALLNLNEFLYVD